jgi:hypothetical protein
MFANQLLVNGGLQVKPGDRDIVAFCDTVTSILNLSRTVYSPPLQLEAYRLPLELLGSWIMVRTSCRVIEYAGGVAQLSLAYTVTRPCAPLRRIVVILRTYCQCFQHVGRDKQWYCTNRKTIPRHKVPIS